MYQNHIMMHQRNVYNIIDLIGDLGGVLELFALFFGFFIGPFTNYSFVMTSLQNLFVVKTREKGNFVVKLYKKVCFSLVYYLQTAFSCNHTMI